ncbi:TVP38/TMEM64 family protein [Alkalinema sp. FACHB-956]|uniref:TVP38/TMEM64 family protein n=1 Tax=Alkalinema sp. FACHB-956 TaxID=2692768 RepID=UPI0018EFA5AD|nr:TVP38/TMEM64 family protein [Alkalinema sp. FACHB-956]
MNGFFEQVLQWSQNLGLVGGLGFIAIYAIATVLLIPGTVLTVGAGAFFGIVWGSLYVLVGATLGAILAFLLGRTVARQWVDQKISGNAKFAAIDRAIGQAGFKIVLLTRLSPVFPFNLLNYALSLTNVSFKDYALASIGMIPGTVMYVYIGSLVGDVAMNHEVQIAQWGIRIVGFVATVAVTVYITRIAKAALDQSIEA